MSSMQIELGTSQVQDLKSHSSSSFLQHSMDNLQKMKQLPVEKCATGFELRSCYPTCGRCSLPFDDDAVPRLLPCNHTFCHLCLKSSLKDGCMYCPRCFLPVYRSASSVPDLRRNFAVDIDLLKGIKETAFYASLYDAAEAMGAQCSLCCYVYGTQRTPRLLSCGHTFCHICLCRALELHAIDCPICHESTALSPAEDVHGLAVNDVLEKLVKDLQAVFPNAIDGSDMDSLTAAETAALQALAGARSDSHLPSPAGVRHPRPQISRTSSELLQPTTASTSTEHGHFPRHCSNPPPQIHTPPSARAMPSQPGSLSPHSKPPSFTHYSSPASSPTVMSRQPVEPRPMTRPPGARLPMSTSLGPRPPSYMMNLPNRYSQPRSSTLNLPPSQSLRMSHVSTPRSHPSFASNPPTGRLPIQATATPSSN